MAWLRSRLLVLTALMTPLMGCASTSAAGGAAPVEPFFYPLPPAPPRLQYLGRFNGSQDVVPPPSALAQFVAGGDAVQHLAIGKPFGLAFHGGSLFVCDVRGLNGMVEFDFEERTFALHLPPAPGSLGKPVDVAFGPDSERYVCDQGRRVVVVHDAGGQFLRVLGDPETLKPGASCTSDRFVFVSNLDGNRVEVFDRRTGEFVRSIGATAPAAATSAPGADEDLDLVTAPAEAPAEEGKRRKPINFGEAPGQLHWPMGVACDPAGNVLVVDVLNARVQRFSPEGDLLQVIGERGLYPGQFFRPKGIACDRAGRVWVVDSGTGLVQVFAPDGSPLMFWGQPNSGAGALYMPVRIAIDYDHVGLFADRVAPGRELEFLVAVTNQFGGRSVMVYGFLVDQTEVADLATPEGR